MPTDTAVPAPTTAAPAATPPAAPAAPAATPPATTDAAATPAACRVLELARLAEQVARRVGLSVTIEPIPTLDIKVGVAGGSRASMTLIRAVGCRIDRDYVLALLPNNQGSRAIKIDPASQNVILRLRCGRSATSCLAAIAQAVVYDRIRSAQGELDAEVAVLAPPEGRVVLQSDPAPPVFPPVKNQEPTPPLLAPAQDARQGSGTREQRSGNDGKSAASPNGPPKGPPAGTPNSPMGETPAVPTLWGQAPAGPTTTSQVPAGSATNGTAAAARAPRPPQRRQAPLRKRLMGGHSR